MKVSKLSTKKKDLKTNPRDALIAEEPKNNKEVTSAATEAAEMATTADGKK
jgi:hypothetical protein